MSWSKALLTMPMFIASVSIAAESGRSMLGAGVGLEFLSRKDAAAGGAFLIQGTHQFTPNLGAGIHGAAHFLNRLDYRWDVAGFVSVSPSESPLFARIYGGGGYALPSDVGEAGASAGLGLGAIVPEAGDLHFAPEFAYRMVALTPTLHAFTFSVSLLFEP